MNYGRTFVEIDLDAVSHNVDSIRNKIPNNTKLLTVVKADAYGHGAIKVAKAEPVIILSLGYLPSTH